MHHLLAKYAEFVGEATCLGKLYKVGRYPGMVLSDNTKDSVHGEVYLLRHADIVLPLLDKYKNSVRNFPSQMNIVASGKLYFSVMATVLLPGFIYITIVWKT
ncbi:MAG: gamma-glutamylcyclotransferase [Methylococcales bacterium]|nr:gamma-glutamylcyclotransferase [Methylococcales bacterium]